MEPDLTRIQKLAANLALEIAALPDLGSQVSALNEARGILHNISPFKAEPVDCVLWVPAPTVHQNSWNPNSVAPPEMRLLARSIEADGYTQPIVTCPVVEEDGPVDMVVDGFHRHRVGKEIPEIAARICGYLPVVRLAEGRRDRKDLMAATIRHNRARGKHGVDAMSALVGELVTLGWKDDEIGAELGMQPDEVLRLKQVTGLAALFAEREFSEAWEPDPQAKRVRSVQPAR